MVFEVPVLASGGAVLGERGAVSGVAEGVPLASPRVEARFRAAQVLFVLVAAGGMLVFLRELRYREAGSELAGVLMFLAAGVSVAGVAGALVASGLRRR